MPLRDFDVLQRESIKSLCELFDKTAPMLASVETMGDDASDLAKSIHAHFSITKFNNSVICTMRAAEMKGMFNQFQGEWWKDDAVKARFNASNGGRDNSILAKILSGPTHTSVERDFSMFEAVNGVTLDKISSIDCISDPKLIHSAMKLDIPGLLLAFDRVTIDKIHYFKEDIRKVVGEENGSGM
mmetsp:Transcript_19909/g.41593  ORF Transcript_19909/g.41593 Transcript_19909/m.41593 type:complete len:185 (+) Transcript_19909:1510-2064(+)